jgi:Zn-dependent peptidase ImmA (M78 family)
MNFAPSEQIGLKSSERNSVPKNLRKKIEALGVLVLKNSELKAFRARGICIYSEVLPVIIFGSESPSAQAFTLVHELAHIVRKQSCTRRSLNAATDLAATPLQSLLSLRFFSFSSRYTTPCVAVGIFG